MLINDPISLGKTQKTRELTFLLNYCYNIFDQNPLQRKWKFYLQIRPSINEFPLDFEEQNVHHEAVGIWGALYDTCVL